MRDRLLGLRPGSRPGPVLAASIVLLLLAGCATPEQLEKAREARIERDRIACEELGFEPETDAYRLCLMIRDTNQRIDVLDQRLRWVESDVRHFRFHRPFGFHRPFRRHRW